MDRSLLVVANALFVLLYIALCYFNRIAIDDFHFLSLARKFDPLEAMIVERSTWSARWASVLLNQVVLSFHGSGGALFMFGVLAFALFVLSVDRILQRASSFDPWMRLNYSILVVCAVFHASFSIDRTWFWLCSACTYLIGMIMLLFGFSTLIGKEQIRIDMIICCIAFLYVGGSSEPLAVFILAVLLLLMLIPGSRTAIPLRMLSIAFFSCLIGFAILYSGGGNFKRASHFQDIGIVHAAVLNVKMCALIILRELPSVLPVILLFSIPIGIQLADRICVPSDRRKVLRQVPLILTAFFTSVYFFQLPITYATQDVGAGRTLFPITFLALIASAAIFLHLLPLVDRWRTTLIGITLGGVIILNGYTLFEQLNVLPAYAAAYDERMRLLEGSKHITGTIVLEPLPPSGLLLSAEISTDPRHFSNQHLRSGLGLRAQVEKAEWSINDRSAITR